MVGRRGVVAPEYITYSVLYAVTILCNKYVLTSLGFQFPTIFQAWQTLVGLFLMHLVSGFQSKEIILRDVGPWIPAMVLYVGTIYSGSVALSQLPIPVFILGQGCGDVILLLCNQNMPSVMNYFSFPIKLAAAIIASWSALDGDEYGALLWLMVHAICSGAYRSLSYWYSTPHWPYSNLSIEQRQYLNYLFSLVILLPSIFLMGHHEKAKTFQHLGANKFYVGSIFSGVFSWAVNKMWTRVFHHGISDTKLQATLLLAKVLTLLLAVNLYPGAHLWSVWIGIVLSVISDILQIVEASLQSDSPALSEEMHDVLVSM